MFRHLGHRREADDQAVVLIGPADRVAAIDREAVVAQVAGIDLVVREVVGPAVAAEEIVRAAVILVAEEIGPVEAAISVAGEIGLEAVETVLAAVAPALEGPEVAALGAEAPAEVGQAVATRGRHVPTGRPRCHILIDPVRGIALIDPADLIGLAVEIGRAIQIVLI